MPRWRAFWPTNSSRVGFASAARRAVPSEVLTDDTRTRVERAWGIVPFNVYAATETAGVGSECSRHRLHVFEDLVVTEVVDERDHPVPPGVAGARVLVTVPQPHAAAHSTRDERLPHAVLGAV